MRSVFTMKFSCSLAKSQESKQMSLKRSWWFGPLYFFFTFPFFQVGISFEANYLIAPNSFFFMHLHLQPTQQPLFGYLVLRELFSSI